MSKQLDITDRVVLFFNTLMDNLKIKVEDLDKDKILKAVGNAMEDSRLRFVTYIVEEDKNG